MSRLTSAVDRLRQRRAEFDAAARDGDVSGQLLALDTLLDYMYKIREHRRASDPGGPAGYDAAAKSDLRGQIAEAIVMLRGKLTHILTTNIEPNNAHLYPGQNTFLGQNTYMGEMLRWPSGGRLLGEHPELHYHSAWWFYEGNLAQVSVSATLDDAQAFLLEDSPLGPLVE